MKTRRAFLAGLLVIVGISAAPFLPSSARLSASELPARLSGREFWTLIEGFSDAGADQSSLFIRSRVNGRGFTCPVSMIGIGMFWTMLGEMQAETRSTACVFGGAPGHGRFIP